MKPFLYLSFSTLTWGLTFPLIKNSISGVDPHLFNALRFTLACLVLLPFFWFQKQKFSKTAIISGLSIGVIIFLGYTFQTFGLRYTSGTHSAFITGLLVVFVPLLSWLFYREKIQRRVLFALAFAVVGLFLMSDAGASPLNFGDLLTLGCALAFALQVLFISRLPKTEAGLTFTFCQLIATAALSVIFFFGQSLVGETASYSFHDFPWASLIFCGVFATAGAFYCQTIAQKSLSATKAAFILITEPIWGAVFSYFLSNEVLSVIAYGGMGLILAALVIVEMVPAKKTTVG